MKNKIEIYREKLSKVTPRAPYFNDDKVSSITKSSYNKQAIDFLFDAETTCEISKIGLDYSSWNKKSKVNKYEVTLKNKNCEFTFMFWDSIHNTEKNISLQYDFYSVLACLSLNYSSNFDEFCYEFEYTFSNESEYIQAKTTYLEIERQDRELRKLFTDEQLEKLSEIN